MLMLVGAVLVKPGMYEKVLNHRVTFVVNLKVLCNKSALKNQCT